jgi:plastocyanin
MSRRPFIATLGLAAALGLAACSGSGSGATVAPTDPPAAATDAPTDAPASDAASQPPAASGPCAPSTDAGTVAVSIEGFAFSPSTVQAAVGDVIEFTNRDSASHTATLDDDSCTTDGLGNDGTGALVFSEPGTYPFHCRIHPDMKGTFEISG